NVCSTSCEAGGQLATYGNLVSTGHWQSRFLNRTFDLLELYSEEPINAEAWIDPEVVKLAGINAEELARYKQSADFADSQGGISQPDPAKTQGPHMTNYPAGTYEARIATPDDIIWSVVDSQPPVKVG
ncbi:MAG: hypothetical protein QNL99_09730, partial [SAR86 cluster bacterium]